MGGHYSRWWCPLFLPQGRRTLYVELTLNPNRSLDRNVLISIVILLLLAVLCPSAAVFYSVPSRRSPLRLRQNGIKTVWHKYIIRLSPNDRFGLNYVLAEVMCLCRTSVFGMCHIVIRERSFIVKCLFVLQEVAFRKAKGHLSLCERCPFARCCKSGCYAAGRG